MKTINIKNYLKLYLIFLASFVIFYLFFKHTVLNDSSISEWLINYKGGFTRRGLGGEILFNLSYIFDLKLRFSIFITQAFFHILYLYLVYLYFRNLKINIIQIFALFTPIFLLYPVSEIEVLGRKEMILFCFFISLMFFSEKTFSKNYLNFSTFFILPLVCLIWEQSILFAPYIAVLIILKNDFQSFKETFMGILITFFPAILSIVFIFLMPLSKEGHELMCDTLLETFNEQCYMSANLLISNTVYFDTLHIHQNANLSHYLRYLGIFIVGFFPLHYLIYKSEFIFKDNFITKNFNLNRIFILLYLPSILLFSFGWDWGRWINILYTCSVLLYFYLYKNSYIKLNNKTLNMIFALLNKKKYLLIVFFIVFAFGWHPKATLSEDIGSLPGYRIPYKAIKFIDILKIRIDESKY
tara:strand:- start:56 stop:1291 length:1236 start_codon:yes stop_codon:yes gene_type:complete